MNNEMNDQENLSNSPSAGAVTITLNDFLQATGLHFIDGLTTSLRRETNAFCRSHGMHDLCDLFYFNCYYYLFKCQDDPTGFDYARAACLYMPELYSFEFVRALII